MTMFTCLMFVWFLRDSQALLRYSKCDSSLFSKSFIFLLIIVRIKGLSTRFLRRVTSLFEFRKVDVKLRKWFLHGLVVLYRQVI